MCSACMCIYMYIYIYIYISVCVSVRPYIYIYICVCVSIYIYIYICTHTYIYRHTHTYISCHIKSATHLSKFPFRPYDLPEVQRHRLQISKMRCSTAAPGIGGSRLFAMATSEACRWTSSWPQPTATTATAGFHSEGCIA